MVTTASQLITANDLGRIFGGKNRSITPVQVNTIIPLEKAVELTEYQLIKMALAEYKTITKAAKALEVSQPTMSRHIQKLMEKMNLEYEKQ